MKLSTKLILSFSLVIILVGGIGFTFSYINGSVKDQVTTESQQAIEEIELAGEMGLQLYHSLTRTQYLIEDQYRQSLSSNFDRGNLSNEVVIKQINESLENFRKSIEDEKKLIRKDHPSFFDSSEDSANVKQLLNQLEKKFGIYSSLVKQLQELSLESYADGKEFFTVTVEPYFRTNLLPLIERTRKTIQQNHEDKIAGLNGHLARIGNIIGIATIFALLIAIGLGFFLYRSIANPLDKLAHAAENVARGNLDDRIEYDQDDEMGRLSKTFNRMAESLSQTTVSRDYVDSIIESMADLLVVTDSDLKITRVNSAGLSMLGMSENELVGKELDTIFKTDLGTVLNNQHNSSSQKITSKNAVLTLNDGEEMPVSVSKGVLEGRDGTVEGSVIVASDITSEKEAQAKITQSLKEKEVLLAEIHHRVKNNLAVISGLLQMQIWEAENEFAANALQQSQLRVRSIALVHEKLYQSDSLSYIEFDTYIRDLLEAIQDTYLHGESKIQVNTELEKIVVNINQAIPCSLLINELVVNSFKHAFNEEEKGVITITMKKLDDQVMLRVKDDGKGMDMEEQESHSMGMSLIETLTKQLDGTLTLQSEDGLSVEVQFAAEEVMQN